MLKIRLARGGTKKRPYYRIVVAEARAPRDGRYIERLGFYNPLLPTDHSGRLQFDTERVRHWLSKGAKPTERIARFFGKEGLVSAPERREQTKKHLPGEKARARAAELAEKRAQAAKTATEAKDTSTLANDSAEPSPTESQNEAGKEEETLSEPLSSEESRPESSALGAVQK